MGAIRHWVSAREPVLAPRTTDALAVLAIAAGLAVIAHFARTWNLFFYDEWSMILYRREGGADAFFAPHNGHLQATVVAIYRALFATAGLGNFWPYHLVSLACHALVVGLLFVYARRRLQPELAALASVLVLMLGWSWETLMWPLMMGVILPVAAFVAVLVIWDREDTLEQPRRLTAALPGGIVALALACSSSGVAVTAGLLLEPLRRRQWRRLGVIAVPALAYAAWYALYRSSATTPPGCVASPEPVRTEISAWSPRPRQSRRCRRTSSIWPRAPRTASWGSTRDGEYGRCSSLSPRWVSA
jgi:hypothetical protein